jgi:hypothetical protein
MRIVFVVQICLLFIGSAVHEWELKNLAIYQAGVLNETDLGARNLQNAMSDQVMVSEITTEVMEKSRTPEVLTDLTKMITNPTFQEHVSAVKKKWHQQTSLANVLLSMNARMASLPTTANRISGVRMETLVADPTKVLTPAMANEEELDEPDPWTIIGSRGAGLSREARFVRGEKNIIEVLERGTLVNVVEIVELPDLDRVRARIKKARRLDISGQTIQWV